MKRKGLIVGTVLMLMMSVAACSNTTEQPGNDSEQIENTEKDQEKDQEKDKEKEGAPVSNDSDKDKNKDDRKNADDKKTETNEKSDKIEINVYKSNDNSNGFDTVKVQIEKLDEKQVLQAMIDQKVLPEDVVISSLKTSEVEGKKSIDLDFDSSFSAYIFNVGSSQEYYAIGSVCNTFLEAYDCEQIQITVNGNVLETGHNDYPGYMSKFE